MVEKLAGAFSGDLFDRDTPGYDQHRAVWNGSIDRHPALIARCADVADVRAALRFARETELEIAVRSGGHSFPGLSVCDDGLVIDLAALKRVAVAPEAGIARVQAGVLLGEMDRQTQAFGMAAPTGAVTHTGVAGLTLGGGIGWLMRKHGLAVDQLQAVEVVTADGQQVTADADRHPDLFWAVRGGGGNFGIVTEFEFNLHRVGPTVLSGLVFWPFEDARAVCEFYRDWCADAPDALTTALVLRKAPSLDIIPQDFQGRMAVGVVCCWSGSLESGERVMQPMRTFRSPALDLTAPRRFIDHQALLDASFPHGIWAYVKACNVKELTDDVIDVVLRHTASMVSPQSSATIWQLGGAVAEVPEDQTAFGGRESGFIFNIAGITAAADGFERERAWARGFSRSLAPHRGGAYVNFLMDEGQDGIRDSYGPRGYDRLQTIKSVYDPENIFHLNQNIPPARREC